MKKIIKDGIELLEFNWAQEELIIETIFDGSVEAYHDLFMSIDGIEPYFRALDIDESKNAYKPLPRLVLSLETTIEGFED